jgi:hypothetical protein
MDALRGASRNSTGSRAANSTGSGRAVALPILSIVRERRQALITAAVTGQIEIPGVAA